MFELSSHTATCDTARKASHTSAFGDESSNALDTFRYTGASIGKWAYGPELNGPLAQSTNSQSFSKSEPSYHVAPHQGASGEGNELSLSCPGQHPALFSNQHPNWEASAVEIRSVMGNAANISQLPSYHASTDAQIQVDGYGTVYPSRPPEPHGPYVLQRHCGRSNLWMLERIKDAARGNDKCLVWTMIVFCCSDNRNQRKSLEK